MINSIPSFDEEKEMKGFGKLTNIYLYCEKMKYLQVPYICEIIYAKCACELSFLSKDALRPYLKVHDEEIIDCE